MLAGNERFNVLVDTFQNAKSLRIDLKKKKVLQDNLITKFLHYDELGRFSFSEAQFVRCVQQDCALFVKEGYLFQLRGCAASRLE